MKKRYAVIAGVAFAIPAGTALANGRADSTVSAAASWATMDANSDGALSEKEVSATPWEATFQDMDSQGDGKVTKSEYQAYVKAMNAKDTSSKDM